MSSSLEHLVFPKLSIHWGKPVKMILFCIPSWPQTGEPPALAYGILRLQMFTVRAFYIQTFTEGVRNVKRRSIAIQRGEINHLRAF